MKTVIAVTLLGLLSFGQARLPPPFPRPGVEKLFENEHLIVWHGVLGVKGVPTAMHHHERDLVGVFLDEGQTRGILQDGTMRDGNPFVRGHVSFSPRGGTHAEEVLVDGTRAVGIEPKLDRPRPAATPPTTPDDGRVLFDNESVLIREYVWAPGVPIRQVLQGVRTVLVGLESGEITETSQDGRVVRIPVVFGQAALAMAEQTRVTVASRGTPRMVVVTVR